jgi:hypothetical protein
MKIGKAKRIVAPERLEFDIPDGFIILSITDEGLIFDVYHNQPDGPVLGATLCNTFEEFANMIVDLDPLTGDCDE